VPCIETIGLEADDIIACYAKAALAEGWQVTIVSSDKDLMQLIRPGLDILKGEMQCLKYPDQKHMYGNATRRRRS